MTREAYMLMKLYERFAEKVSEIRSQYLRELAKEDYLSKTEITKVVELARKMLQPDVTVRY